MVSGISPSTFIVSDLERMETLMLQILDARCVYRSDEKQVSLAEERFYLVGNRENASAPGSIWIAVMKGESLAERTYNHYAFKIDEGEGRSIYFYDWDNHLLELHTGTLEERLARYLRTAT